MEVAVIKTIGELIQDTRRASNITLTQLSELSGIPKGTISRIENGEVKRPQFSTVYPLTKALNIPLETLIDYYVEIERRSDSLLHILHTTIQNKRNNELIQKVATKYLESCNEDSYDLTEKLYQNIDSIEDTPIKLLLYNLIIEHSRSHGIMPYIAKGLYQRYLIERNDFNKLKETYYSGKYILHYADFLPHQERIELYYKLGVHAYNLRLYYESIEHCRRVLAEDTSENQHKIYALGILVDAHCSVEEYKEAEMYSMQYKQFDYLNYPHIKGNVVLMDALFVAKKGDTDKAIMLLKSFLETCDDIHVIPASKQLLQLYLQQNNLEGAKNVLEGITFNPTNLNTSNPLIFSRYADYLQIKGEYYLAVGNYEACINHMVEGASYYSKVNTRVKEKLCRIIKTAFTHGDIL
ncbi:Transcriptional regulator, contains XRE-family HTH domain [Paenibacillus sp. cl6col]|uniref:helix-turn-helix domain-containing protein n=1 Tax=Paenibacillus sp. cl6col TaxID=1761878 RepID=UPI000887C350|nr:helix-turn-helix transcriptional regulator [Paenibacillus sp. cl6col]SDF57427.1 Transcriptional regulator, contains XRE-family HTH domain [Paenibacillus sp. cl6col]